MTKIFKLKILILCMAILAFVTSVTAFSVSYAKWIVSDNASVTGSAQIGEWGEVTPTPGELVVQFENGIAYYDENGNAKSVNLEGVTVKNPDGNVTINFYVHTNRNNQVIKLALEGQAIEFEPNLGVGILENGVYQLEQADYYQIMVDYNMRSIYIFPATYEFITDKDNIVDLN